MKMMIINHVQNYQKLEDYFSSNMVDVAGLEMINSGVCKLIIHEKINIEKEDDKMRLLDLVQQALNECREPYARIKIMD